MSIALALLLLLPLPAVQEESPDTLKQREDYATYTEISEMTDPAARATAYMDFLEEGPHATLVDFVVGNALQDLQALTEAGNYDAVYPRADRIAALRPEHAATAGALALNAAAIAGHSEMIVKHGEPYYQANPSPQIALILARAFNELDNQARMREYGQVAVSSGEFPMAETWGISFEILRDHDGNGRKPQAVAIARDLRSGLRSAPEGVDAATWRDIQIYLLDLIGTSDFQAERWREALASFDAILALDGRNDKAWYFRGNSMLQLRTGVNDASVALGKAVVLNGSYATPARTLLDRTAASNAPPGAAAVSQFVERILAQARRELGL